MMEPANNSRMNAFSISCASTKKRAAIGFASRLTRVSLSPSPPEPSTAVIMIVGQFSPARRASDCREKGQAPETLGGSHAPVNRSNTERSARGRLSKLSPGTPFSVGNGIHRRGNGTPRGFAKHACSSSYVGCKLHVSPVALKDPVQSV